MTTQQNRHNYYDELRVVERTPLVEMQPLVFYVRRYEGETQNVPVTISVNMREAY